MSYLDARYGLQLIAEIGVGHMVRAQEGDEDAAFRAAMEAASAG